MDELADALEGRYANLFRVGFNAVEFVIEFGQLFPDAPEHYWGRMITSPLHVREFLRVLDHSVAQYEHEFGPIPVPEE